MKRTWTITLALALVIAMSAAAFAAKAPPPVQTPLAPTKIPQFAQEIDRIANGGIPVSLYPAALNVNLCEFQTDVLPPGTPVVAPALPPAGFVLGKTYVWGYQAGTGCTPQPALPTPPVPGVLGTGRTQSYLGPVVVAGRHTPTAMTFINQLPDANVANVKAYSTSTDQTLIWGDPLGLDAFALQKLWFIPELNQCWHAAQTLVPPALMPANCNNNYGFWAPQVGGAVTPSYASPVPAAVHIHGGEVPSVLDGGPDAWWTPTGIYGHGFYTRHVKSLPTFPAAKPTLPTAVAALPGLPTAVAGLPALPLAIAWLPLLPDPLYPPDGTTIYFDQTTLLYYVNIADVWTDVSASVAYPLTTVIFNSLDSQYYQNALNVWTVTPVLYPLGAELYYTGVVPAAYYQNIANVWTAVAGTYPLNSLIQVAGVAYVNQNNVWVLGIAPFTDGQLVFNETDGKNYKLTGGVWGVSPVDRATYVYPNGQEAAPVWFHDHMLGATRLNVYAGIAGGYVITETPDTLAPGLHPLGLSDATWVPGAGQTWNDRPFNLATDLVEPLIIQDRMFDTNGQLFFPNVGINPEHPYWVPEFVGDTILVNGKAWPFMNVQPRRYKFIFLNGSNARAYELYFPAGPSIAVISNDQGYLDTPRIIIPSAKVNNKLTMMPGERYEVIIDFGLFAGKNLILQNTARTPYVGGAPVNGTTTGRIMQFRVGAAVAGFVDNSFNPAAPGAFIRAKVDPVTNKMVPNPMVRLSATLGTSPAPGVKIDKVRRLTLNEVIAAGGPLEILVNNTLYDGSHARPPYTDPITGKNDFTPITSIWNTSYYSELPYEGETELWEIINLTADAHPMHPHLVAFQVLNRTPLNVKGYMAFYNAEYLRVGLPIDAAGPPYNYNNSNNPLCSATNPARGDARYAVTAFNPATGSATASCYLGGNPDPGPLGALALVGPPVAPMAQEIGWKDTVQALPNMVTRVLVRFGRPDLPTTWTPDQVGYEFSPNGGHGYVWHCHIVDHEDNEMMRPYTVINGPYPETYLKGIHF